MKTYETCPNCKGYGKLTRHFCRGFIDNIHRCPRTNVSKCDKECPNYLEITDNVNKIKCVKCKGSGKIPWIDALFEDI